MIKQNKNVQNITTVNYVYAFVENVIYNIDYYFSN